MASGTHSRPDMLRLVVHVDGSHRQRRSGADLVMRQRWVGRWLKYVAVDGDGATYELRVTGPQAVRVTTTVVRCSESGVVQLSAGSGQP